MQGNADIVALLNRILANELTAINQYFLHARIYRNWGFGKLDAKVYAESIDEMKHADLLIERILFLEGQPNMQHLGKLKIGNDPEAMLRNDLALELEGLPLLRETVAACEAAGDYVSRELAESILGGEEEHIDWLETQLELIDRVGVQNYLQSQVA